MTDAEFAKYHRRDRFLTFITMVLFIIGLGALEADLLTAAQWLIGGGGLVTLVHCLLQ